MSSNVKTGFLPVRGAWLSLRATVVLVVALVGCIDLARPPALVDPTLDAGGGRGGAGGRPSASDAEPAVTEVAGAGGVTGAGGGEPGAGGAGGEPGAGGAGGTGMSEPDAMGMAGSGGGTGTPDVMPDMPVIPMKLALGASCVASSDCNSNFCADGVCCESACTGLCQTCAAIKGMCRPAAAGTDPRNACPDDGAATCQRNGFCDGAQACQRYAANTVCSAASCSSGQITGTSRCDQAGVCQRGATTSCAPYGCTTSATPSCRLYCLSKSDCAGKAECFGGICGGVVGTYFATSTLSGRSVTRTDRNIDFDFQGGAPEPTLPSDLFSVRWTGKITAPSTGTYTFHVLSDDGVRLWVAEKPLVDDWRKHAPEEWSGQVALTANTPVAIKLEYFEDDGTSLVRLFWSGPGLSKQVVPATAFRPE